MTDDATDEEAALELLDEYYDLEECPKCEIRREFGLVLGNERCANGVAVCPNCGTQIRVLTADPAGVATEWPYEYLHKRAMRWVPEWASPKEDTTSDWVCGCGKTWQDHDEALLHVATEHPENSRLSSEHHDRYPWKNVELAEEAVVPDG